VVADRVFFAVWLSLFIQFHAMMAHVHLGLDDCQLCGTAGALTVTVLQICAMVRFFV
jgi:hypothetical protein